MDLYQENILEHYKEPHNKGEIKDAKLRQSGANLMCGDHLVLYINHDDTKITEVKFEGKGCAISQAAASMLTDELMDMPLVEAKKITKEDVLDMLGIEIGPTRLKCALLGLDTLKAALR